VGAVVVESGKIVARGYHARFGGPHAEVNCLSKFDGNSARATLYVNLEPCPHHGKTPPCTEAILSSGIRRVVIGMVDPNPLVRGRGVRKLRRHGVRVRTGVLREEAREVNRTFIKHVTTGLPYVHVKIAQSLDGYIATARRRRRRITSLASRTVVHRWRAKTDAVLVGAGTVKADDPRLDVRHCEGRDPAVVILDGHCSVPLASRVFRGERRVFLFIDKRVAKAKRKKIARLESRGVRVVAQPGTRGRLSLRRVLRRLGRENIGSVLVEGGGEVFDQFLRSDLVDEMSIFVAPAVFGHGLPLSREGSAGAERARFLPKRAMTAIVGPDVLIKAWKE
jgi:diaminohydroxyphosphoribosylaminopyrimidine deaminase/5-amino-6-(5-phosphoribosylamino)uracil reductase